MGLWFSSSVNAATCPIPLSSSVNINVQNITSNIKYNYEYTSRQIKGMDNENANFSTSNLLGIFKSNKHFQIKPAYTTYGNEQIGYCIAIKQIDFIIKNSPEIYISREAQQFACTKHRTEQHELLHYKFDNATTESLKPYLINSFSKLFSQHFYFKNQDEIKMFVEKTNQYYLKLSSNFIAEKNKPLHDQIDTTDNYKKESSYCSYQENVSLTKLLQMGY